MGKFEGARIKAELANRVKIFTDEYDRFVYENTHEDDLRGDLVHATFIYDENEDTVFPAVILGFGTSYRETHTHPPHEVVKHGRCSGCRWSDITIMWSDPHVIGVEADPSYVVLSRGCSIVPGEEIRSKIVWTTDADEVLEHLHVPVPKHLGLPPGTKEVPKPNEDALMEAASRDERLAVVADEYTVEKDEREMAKRRRRFESRGGRSSIPGAPRGW